MATQFITNLERNTPWLSSEINSIIAEVDTHAVEVSLIRDPEGEAYTFFRATLYEYDARVEITEVGRMIENEMLRQDIRESAFACVVDGAQMDFYVVYCEAILNSDFNLEESFYSTQQVRLVHDNSAIILSHANHGILPYRIKVAGTDADGKLVAVEKEVVRNLSNGSASFAVREIINWATESGISQVGYFAISLRDAQVICFLVHDPFFLTFQFRNVFNAPEYIDVVGTVKQKSKVEREIAVCSGVARQYDYRTERTYEVSTGALHRDEARAIESLIFSRSVNIMCREGAVPVIITDHTVEQDNDDNELCSIKFTFRFVDERLTYTAQEIETMSPCRTNIFTEQFTEEFA